MRSRSFAAVVLAVVMVTMVSRQSPLPDAQSRRSGETTSAQPIPDLPAHFRGVDAKAPTYADSADSTADPLLVDGLRNTLELLLWEAGDASDPAALKQRLAGLIGKHFPAAFAAPALALTERYLDYRVALGELRAPYNPTDPRALRDTFEARKKIRLQFFDSAEYNALFAREAELDRYTLARLEIARNSELTPEQRIQALQAADHELSKQHLAQRNASIEHMAAAAQTDAFNTHNTDSHTRYAARSAQYGTAAAHALAELDREEQHWQQRLDLYSQARAPQDDMQQLRAQLFSQEELQRVDAALALRKATAPSPAP